MYRSSSKTSQLGLFSSVAQLKGKALKVYNDADSWHNQFPVQFTNRINKEIFRPLFHEDFGVPNAPIRVLIGMMIMKEARGWSDAQLLEEYNYNILVRNALGLMNMDTVPAGSTYYYLRSRIVKHEVEDIENLIEKSFAQVTKSQAIELQVNGNKIRMDRKLMGSNIAWYSRYELIHETDRLVYSEKYA